MNYRHYVLQTDSKRDAMTLEDYLHQSLHTDTILRADQENRAALDFDRQLQGETQEDSESKSLVLPEDASDLYEIVASNSFDVEHKLIKRLRFFSREYWAFGEKLPKYEISVLISGNDSSLVLLHHHLVTDPNYSIVKSANVTEGNWVGKTNTYSGDWAESWADYFGKYTKEHHPDLTIHKSIYPDELSTDQSPLKGVEINASGQIEDVLRLRNILSVGFLGIKIVRERVDYS